MNKRIINLLIHVPIWLVVFYFILKSNKELGNTVFQISSSFINICWLAGTFYFYFLYLVPKYLEKKKIILFILFSILFIGISPLIVQIWDIINYSLFGDQDKIPIYRLSGIGLSWNSWGGGAQGTLFLALLGTIYRFVIDWFKNINEKEDLRNKNLQSELMLLKSKLNPHLLFNTLNNIDTLIQKSPKKASEILTKLSDLLRYVVYETDNEKIPLSVEVDNLKKYIDLERVRISNPESVTITTNIQEEVLIPPMIFFPFVENGFKHSNLNNKNHKFNILIHYTDGLINFECVNSIFKHSEKSENFGVGLELAKKRLELLFSSKYEISIQQSENEFFVKLQINPL